MNTYEVNIVVSVRAVDASTARQLAQSAVLNAISHKLRPETTLILGTAECSDALLLEAGTEQ